MLILVLMGSFPLFGQQYDVYVEYRYVGDIFPYNANVYVGVNSAISFNQDFQSPYLPPSAFTKGGILSNSTTKTSLDWNTKLNFGLISESNNGTVRLGTGGRGNFNISGQGYSWSGSIRMINSITVTVPHEHLCYKNKISIHATEGHPSAAYRWTYKALGSGDAEKPLLGNFATQNVSLEDLYPDNPEQYVETTIQFTVYNDLVGYSSTTNYYWIGCSPTLLPELTKTTNENCYGSNDGSVTLTFETDVADGSQMRYFLYEGAHPGNPSDNELKALSPTFPNTTKQTVLDSLLTLTRNSNGYSGTASGLIGSSVLSDGTVLDYADYFIVYQEVDYSQDPIEVKSGGITPNTFRISRPSEIKISIPPQNLNQPNCFGDTGSVTLIGHGGGFPPNSDALLEYGILGDDNSWQTSPTFNSLDAGEYIFLARSSNICLSDPSEKIIITLPPELTLTNPSPGTASSNTSSDGVISINYNGGTPDYTFQLAKLNEISSFFEFVSNPNMINHVLSKEVEFQNLGVGTYRITITDNNGTGCTLTSGDILVSTTPTPKIDLINTTQITCLGGNNGSITANVSDGVAPYNYQWTINGVISTIQNNGNQVISLNNISEPGEYILKVASRGFIDFNDPSGYVTTTTNLKAPAEVIIQNAIVNNITCSGAQDGSITITPSGGISYQYKLDFFEPWTDLNANTIPISSGGFYDIYLRNGNGCEAIPLLDLLVEEPNELVISNILTTNPNAINSNDGTIDITLEGGTLPYSYLWTGPNGVNFSTEDLSGLTPGDYQVSITDSNGCKVNSTTIPISDPSLLFATLNQTVSLECYGDDFAELTANVNGGSPPYTYGWFQTENGKNTRLDEDSAIIRNLAEGTYFVQVTDANGVSVNATPIMIAQPDLLSITVENITDVACNGTDTGAIDISVTGGTAPYEYLWSNGATSEDIANVPYGNYSLEVLDSSGCSTEVEFNIGSPNSALTITNESIKNISEYQGNDGSISLELFGGTAPYAIIWTKTENGQIMGNDMSISNLSVGNYEISITDANGCSLSKTYIIEQPDIVAETIVPISCSGQNDGSIAILVNQGDGIFGYNWNTGATTNSISNLSAGSYTVTITGIGDSPITRTYIIDDPLLWTVDLGGDKTLCAGQVMELDATVEDASASYLWTSDTGFTSSKPKIKIAATGNYSVMVSNSTGCSATGSVFIEVNSEEISAEFAVSSQIFVGESLVAVDISYPLPEMIEWIVPEGATLRSENQDELELLFAEPGEYEIGILTKRGLCEATQIKKVLVLEKDLLIAGKNDGHPQKKVNDFIIYPNPTNGKFSADVSLNEVGEIGLKIFSFANNTLIDHKKGKGKKLYSVPFDLAGTPSGVYAVLLETPYGNALRKVVIK